ncbi:hypothetical protein L1049_002035 [Liquidambar formosana]|uniref:Formin-like protein n=1 Tax=Liquidambar formosana TaxID=63359 RepID=A0AAP0NGJ3_LIQFO
MHQKCVFFNATKLCPQIQLLYQFTYRTEIRPVLRLVSFVSSTNAFDVKILGSLLKFAPNKEEECKFKGYRDDSPIKLDPAERFLRALLGVPFAFKRIEVLFYITNFNIQVEFLMKSYESIKAVCKELRNNSTFLKLLDIVLKAGISHGDAHACNFDTLLELINIKATDQRSTLLHMAVKDICSRFCPSCKRVKLDLQAVTNLSSELTKVKKAATIDFNDLSSYASDLFKGIKNVEDVKRWNEAMLLDKSGKKFSHSMKGFTQNAEEEIARIQAQESSALSLVKEIIEHFNENPAEEEAHPFKIFIALKEFLSVLDQICKEILMSHN